MDHIAVGGDDLGGEQVVNCQSVLADQEADAAGEGDAADPDRAGVSQPGDPPALAGGNRVFARRGAGPDPGALPVGVDLDRLQFGEVDHQPAVAGSVAGPAVPAAADGELEAALARGG